MRAHIIADNLPLRHISGKIHAGTYLHPTGCLEQCNLWGGLIGWLRSIIDNGERLH